MFTRTLCRLRHDFFLRQSKKAYPTRAPKTNNIQTNIHAVMAFIPSALGDWVVTVLKILMSTRNKVINMAIRPGTTSGGTRKLTHDTTTNSPADKKKEKKINSAAGYIIIFTFNMSSMQETSKFFKSYLFEKSHYTYTV